MPPSPGRIRMTAPAKAMAAASQRHLPTLSPSSGMARIMPKIGLRKEIAVASASGIAAAAANIQRDTGPAAEGAGGVGLEVGAGEAGMQRRDGGDDDEPCEEEAAEADLKRV